MPAGMGSEASSSHQNIPAKVPVYPAVAIAMKKSNSSQLANLKLAMECPAADYHHSQAQ
jgi:hypothetical protein